MPKFHYSTDGHLRFYVPRKMARILKWPDRAKLTAIIDDDGTVVITMEAPNTVRGWFSRQAEYSVIQMPIKHMTGRDRIRLDLIGDNKLIVKFFE